VNCARWDLCGGYRVTGIPTAILDPEQKVALFRSRLSADQFFFMVSCPIASWSRLVGE